MKTTFRTISIFVCLIFVFGLLGIANHAALAEPATLYVDAAGVCGGYTPCYQHPQDAVNAANPGDTILVYPGTYDSRYFVCDVVHPTWCSPNDNWAPALIVYKDGLTIKSVEGPINTIIQSTHVFWSNAIAVQNSTAGGISGVTGWNPSAVIIVANDVTIDGFTLHRPFNCTISGDCFNNTAGVFIGSKAAGYTDFLGNANGAIVQNNIFSDVWHAVYIWHSSGNKIVDNTVAPLATDHWAAISTYDGWDNAQIALGSLSENNLIAHNTLANKGIALGAWAPSNWTSNAGSEVCSNTMTQVGVTYTHGPVLIAGNDGGFWEQNTDKVLRVLSISYTGDTGVFPIGTPINLSAQLGYDGSADGSGVEVTFTVGGVDYHATTIVGGTASTTVTPSVGVFEIQVKVRVCDVEFLSDKQFLAVYDPAAGFVTGGGWIWSPLGADKDHPEMEGKASFGFVAKYKKGANVPDGTTEFQFKAGNLNFRSTSYDWLVVAGTNAKFKGVGTINGEGTYKFMITADDGSPDAFRIQIWDAEDGLVYDNGSQQVLGGGSIVIHK